MNGQALFFKPQALSKEQANRLEQRSLRLSLCGVIALAFSSISYGLYIHSDVVILNGIFTLISLIGSSLNLIASKLVIKPEDKRFQYGYWHVEPLVHCVNGLMMLIICGYSFLNGLEGIRSGGSPVDYERVIWFSIVSGSVCGSLWAYGFIMSLRLNSQLLRNDSREWLMDFAFSLVTLTGFMVLFFLDEPWRAVWVRYADSAMVSVMALMLLPLPLLVLKKNIPEVLLMTSSDEELVMSIDKAMQKINAEYKITSYTSHVVKVGRSHFIEVNMLVGPDFELQSVEQQDKLREEIWQACGKSLDEVWLSICITADPRWS